MVSHAGSRLLADLADVTGLTGAFTDTLRRLRPRGTGHAPRRIAVDLAVMLADGGEAIADLALLRDQAEVFALVASTVTTWRLLAGIVDVQVNVHHLVRMRMHHCDAQVRDPAEGVGDP